MTSPISMVRIERLDGYWHMTYEDGSTAWPCVDYLIQCVDFERLSSATVELRAYSLKAWLAFIGANSIHLFDAGDCDLVKFALEAAAREGTNKFGDARARQRSANQIIRGVYLFYAWLQRENEHSGALILGRAGHQITSSLNSPMKCRGRSNYPAAHRFCGERSKHTRRFIPSESDRRNLTSYFYQLSPRLARRNCLLFDLALTVGWRRGAILSLLVEQFLSTEKSQETYMICPPKQKFGYALSFTVDSALHSRVSAYIAGDRAEIIKRTGSTSNSLFLNYRDGSPLSTLSVSRLFSDARSALGLPYGAGLHSWRRAFANKVMNEELDRRKRLGIAQSFTDVAAVVARRMGHESLRSQEAYLRGDASLRTGEDADHS